MKEEGLDAKSKSTGFRIAYKKGYLDIANLLAEQEGLDVKSLDEVCFSIENLLLFLMNFKMTAGDLNSSELKFLSRFIDLFLIWK